MSASIKTSGIEKLQRIVTLNFQ